MKTESTTATDPTSIRTLRAALEKDDRSVLSSLRAWIIIQAILIIFFLGYMTWITSTVDDFTPDTLTVMASAELQQSLPQIRENLKEYALSVAPEVTEHARLAMLELPQVLRIRLEQEILTETDRILLDFEQEFDASLAHVLEENIEFLRQEVADVETDEERLDVVVNGVSQIYRQKMIDAVDAMYAKHTKDFGKLNDYLVMLQEEKDLTETQKIDKQLIEAWMVLVHKHQITLPADFREF